MHQQDSKNFVAEICKNTQSELIAKLSDPKLSGALLNSVSSSLKEEIVTAVISNARYQSHWKSGHVGLWTSNTVLPQ